MREQLIAETLENAEKEITRAQMWIEFYEDFVKSVKDKKDVAQHLAKIEGIKKGMEFNKAVIKFFKK